MFKEHLSQKWVNRFIKLAELTSTWSKDPNTKIGAVIVEEEYKDIISHGYNGLARGVNDDIQERYSRENGEKYFWCAHAERNAVYNAARTGRALQGHTLILNKGLPCTGCAIAIIQSGIKRVYCAMEKMEMTKWHEESERSVKMLEEAGVDVVQYGEDK
tara:strand:+ start:1138 stop:1614 length:477 start_codon:yes stop_codon:yes gene_type:complete